MSMWCLRNRQSGVAVKELKLRYHDPKARLFSVLYILVWQLKLGSLTATERGHGYEPVHALLWPSFSWPPGPSSYTASGLVRADPKRPPR